MVSFFKERSPAAVFWLIIICFGLHSNALLNSPPITISQEDGFFYYLLSPLKNADAYFVSLLYVLLVFLIALQLNYALNSLHLFPKPAYTPALAFVLFSALLPAFNTVSTALFTCNLFIWILYSACKLYSAPNAKASIYNFGLLTGLTIILYFPSAPLVLIAMLALVIIRPFRLNEWFVLIFGLLTPAYLLAAYLFLTSRLNLLPSSPQQVFDFTRLPVQPLFIIISFAVAALATLSGIFSVQNAGSNVLIQVRKSWSLIFVSLVFIVPAMFFITGAYPSVLFLIAVPAAAYTGFTFASGRNILPVIFFWALLGLAIYNNWFANYSI